MTSLIALLPNSLLASIFLAQDADYATPAGGAAGQPGWAAIIPIFNLYILCKIVGRPAWWVSRHRHHFSGRHLFADPRFRQRAVSTRGHAGHHLMVRQTRS